jgi:hypothetical protein
MSRSRLPLVLGLGAAGGVGYYLYSAGGNAKAAEAKFESTNYPSHDINNTISLTLSSP